MDGAFMGVKECSLAFSGWGSGMVEPGGPALGWGAVARGCRVLHAPVSADGESGQTGLAASVREDGRGRSREAEFKSGNNLPAGTTFAFTPPRPPSP
jgi:hypothetical protein